MTPEEVEKELISKEEKKELIAKLARKLEYETGIILPIESTQEEYADDTEPASDSDSKYSKYLKYTLPSSLFVPKRNAMEPDFVNPVIVKDDTLKSDGFATLNPETGEFKVTVPPYVEVVEVNVGSVVNHFNANNTTLFSNINGFPDIFSIMLDESQRPCCKWYSPSESEIKAGAMQQNDYPFNRGRKDPSCSNPAVSGSKGKYVNCLHSESFSSCRFSEFGTWEDVNVAFDGDTPALSIRRNFYSNRMPFYELFDQSTGEVIIPKTNDLSEVKKAFDSAVEKRSLFVKNSKSSKRSYFAAVLT